MTMTTNQFFRLFNTCWITATLIYVWFYVYANREIPEPEPDMLTKIEISIWSWHKYRWEYQTDIEMLIDEWYILMDSVWYEASIFYHMNWEYWEIDSKIKDKLKKIDALIAYCNNKIEWITEKKILVEEPVIEDLGL